MCTTVTGTVPFKVSKLASDVSQKGNQTGYSSSNLNFDFVLDYRRPGLVFRSKQLKLKLEKMGAAN